MYPNVVNCFQQFTNRENKQLGDIDCDGDAKLTNADELVDKRSMERLISRSALRALGVRWRSTHSAATRIVPMNQTRKVLVGIVGSSWASTTARTSTHG